MSRITTHLLLAVFALSIGGATVSAAPPGVRPETARLNGDEQREFDQLLAELHDAGLLPEQRRAAAALLLNRGWPAALHELQGQLTHSDDVTLLRAVVQGIGDSNAPDTGLVDPLFQLLDTDDTPLRSDVATTLGRFQKPAVTRRLVELALERHGTLSTRLGAILALTDHRNPSSAAALIELTRHDDEPIVRDAAFSALARFTGLTHLGHDARVWGAWWDRVRGLDDAAWQAELMRSVSARGDALDRRAADLLKRLTESCTRRYDLSDEAGRIQLLVQMLGDLPELRILALQLAQSRLSNTQPIEGELRDAIRAHLHDDASEAVRAGATRLMELLADEPAAWIAADHLLVEKDESVRTAYLRLLARVPVQRAVSPALQLLHEPGQRGPAALFLSAAHREGLLAPEQAASALDLTRSAFFDPQAAPPVELFKLLGNLGTAEDRQRVVPYLEGDPPALRIAAIQAFENESWEPSPLLAHLDDPEVRRSIWEILGKRGAHAETLLKLIEHEPSLEAEHADWARAVASISARLNPEGLTRVSESLGGEPARSALHESVLLSAAGLGADLAPIPSTTAPDGAVEHARVESELLLVGFYLRHNEPGKANLVLTRLSARDTLTDEQRRRVETDRLVRMLQQKAFDEAESHTQSLLSNSNGPSIHDISVHWLDTLDRAIGQDPDTEAVALAARIEKLFAAQLDAPSRERFESLKKRLPAPAPVNPA